MSAAQGVGLRYFRFEERVYGLRQTSGFSEVENSCKRLLSEVDDREKETLRLSSLIRDLPSLASQIAGGEGVTEEELSSGGRSRRISKARRVFCQVAVKKMGHSGADVARFLGVTTSAVFRAAGREESSDLRKYL